MPAGVMQNGDFPEWAAKFLDYRLVLHYKEEYENQNGGSWAFLRLPGKKPLFRRVFTQSNTLAATPFPRLSAAVILHRRFEHEQQKA